MARTLIRHTVVVRGRGGEAVLVQAAEVTPLIAGTSTPIAAYAAAAGGGPLAEPIRSDAMGQVMFWADLGSAAQFDVLIESDGSTVAAGTSQPVNFDAFVESLAALVPAGSDAYSVISAGAVGDGVALYDAAISAGSPILNSPSANWSITDIGKVVAVMGAGVAGVALASRITNWIGPHQVRIADNASTTVTASDCTYGTDNAAAFAGTVALFNGAQRGAIFVPAGIYMTTAKFAVPGGVELVGAGADYNTTFQGSHTPTRGSVIVGAGAGMESVVQLGGDGDRSAFTSGQTYAVVRKVSIEGHEVALCAVKTVSRHAEIRDCSVWRGIQFGAWLYGFNSHLYDSTVSQQLRGHAVIVDSTVDTKIERNEIRGGYLSNVNVHTSADTTLIGNHLYSGASPNTVNCPNILWDGMSRSGLLVIGNKLDAVNGPAVRIAPGANATRAQDLTEIGGGSSTATAALSDATIMGNTVFNQASMPDATWPIVEFAYGATGNRVKSVSVCANNWYMISFSSPVQQWTGLIGQTGPGATVILADASIGAGSNALSSPSASFVNPTDVGKIIRVPGAGAGGTMLASTIATVVDANNITTTDNATTAVVAGPAIYPSANAASAHSGITAWGNTGAFAARLWDNIEPVVHGGNYTADRAFAQHTDDPDVRPFTKIASPAAYQLQDVRLQVKRALGTDVAFGTSLDGDGHFRWQLRADGQHFGGDGTTEPPTQWGHVAAKVFGVPADHAIRTGTGATGSRPSAVTAGAGALWFDVTLGALLTSNGTTWQVLAPATGLLRLAGTQDCSGDPNYPAATKGDVWLVTVAGKIGGASGPNVGVGDWFVAVADNAGGSYAGVGASWDQLNHELAGPLLAANNLADVSNPAAALGNLGGAPLDSPAFTTKASTPELDVTGTGGAGFVNLPVQSSAPGAPASGNARLYSGSTAGREFARLLGSIDKSMRRLGEKLWDKPWSVCLWSGTTSLKPTGHGNWLSTGTLTSLSATANGSFNQLASSASTNFDVSLLSSAGLRRGAAADLLAGMFSVARLYYPDASYDSSGVSTGSRIYGLVLANLSAVSDLTGSDAPNNKNFCGFRRIHVNGGTTDTNWRFVTCNGAAQTDNDTGMPFVAQHVYMFSIWCPAGSTTIYWQIDDQTAGSTASGSTSATLPGATATLNVYVLLRTIDAVARAVQFDRVYWEADRG